MGGLKLANLALRFLLEFFALGCLAYGGYHLGTGQLAKIALAVALPLVAAVLWGAFVAPRRLLDLPLAPRLAIEAVIIGAAAAALSLAGQPVLAAAFAAIFLANRVLTFVWRQEGAGAG